MPNRLVQQDEFSGTSLDRRWSWIREPAATDDEVADGLLRFDVQAADLFTTDNSASVLVRNAPRGDDVVETKVRIPDLPAGCCFNFAQAGLVVYGDDDDVVKLSSASLWETRQTEFAKEVFPVPTGWSRYGNTVVGAPGLGQEWTWLRIVVERLSGQAKADAGGDTERYTACTSQDGQTWVRGGAWTHTLGQDARIGPIAFGEPAGQDVTAEFDHVRVYSLKGGPRGS